MPAHHVSLAFQELTFVDTELLSGIVAKVGAVYELDLSNNEIAYDSESARRPFPAAPR